VTARTIAIAQEVTMVPDAEAAPWADSPIQKDEQANPVNWERSFFPAAE